MAMNRANRMMGHFTQENTEQQMSTVDCAFMDNVEQAPADAILGVKEAYKQDKDPSKVNLSVGAYRTNEGKPLVLQCVRKAEELILADKGLNKEYLRQRGDQDFAALARKMLFGQDCKAIAEGRVATVQSLSGTGALRIGAEFIKRFLPGRSVYVSNPTWGAHKSILAHAGVKCEMYRYWDPKSKGLDIEGMIEDLKKCPMGSVILLHPAAHNPTGVDPTQEQWKLISQACHENGNICWFDSAYQGFATGDLDRDAFAVQYFTNHGHPVVASQSFAKNFGLYGERIGSFNVVCANQSRVEPVLSQLDIIIRNLYSNPPKHGANIVKAVLSSKELTQMWRDELLVMSQRISAMRTALKDELTRLGTPGDWSHITSQIGMFSFTGLNKAQVANMLKKHHVYMLGNGRISMAGVTTSNVAQIAKGIDDSVRTIA